MASLADRIKKNTKTTIRGPGGVLTEQSPEEIQKLSAQAGLQAPPTTPLGQSLLGASKDQQKMAGTPQQKQAALSLSQEPTSLSDTLRRQQTRTQATQDEQAKIQKAQDMQGLGNVSSKVQQFIEAQKQQLANNAPALQVQAATEFQETDLSPIANDLAALRQNPSDLTALARVNEFLGRDVNSLLSEDELNQLYESSTQAISRGGAQAIQDTLKVSDLVQQGNLGYDTTQLSDLLGIPADQVANLTIPELSQMVQNQLSAEFSTSLSTQQQAISPLAGGAEQAAAQALSREQSAVGITATEADFARLEDQIAKANTVTFGGEEMTIEEALSDDTISQAIVDYMNAAPGSESRKLLEEKEPSLVKFIKDNEAVFNSTVKQLGESAGQLKDINEANKGLVSAGGATIDTKLASELIPGFGKISTQKIDRTQVPVLQLVDSLPESQKATFISNLNDTYTTLGKEYVDQLVGMTPQELENLGVTTNSGTWPVVKQNAVIMKDLKEKQANMSREGFTKYMAEKLLGGMDQFKQMTDTVSILAALGEAPPGDMGLSYDIMSRLMNDPNYVLTNLDRQTSASNLKAAASNGTWDINRITSGAQAKPSTPLYTAVGEAMRDGVITMEESQNALAATGNSYNGIKDLTNKVKQWTGNKDIGWLDIQVREMAKKEAFQNQDVIARIDILNDRHSKWANGSVAKGDEYLIQNARNEAKQALDLIRAWYPEAMTSSEVVALQQKLDKLMEPKPVYVKKGSYWVVEGKV